MTDRELVFEDHVAPDRSRHEPKEPVSVARLRPGAFAPKSRKSRRRAAAYVEEYEIGIGRWKATITKQVDRAGRTGLTARFDAGPRSPWRPKRRQRLFTTRGGWRQQPG